MLTKDALCQEFELFDNMLTLSKMYVINLLIKIEKVKDL